MREILFLFLFSSFLRSLSSFCSLNIVSVLCSVMFLFQTRADTVVTDMFDVSILLLFLFFFLLYYFFTQVKWREEGERQ